MIPKVIHYIWFGNNKLDETSEKCIQSWKDKLQDFELKLWTEKDIDISNCKYAMQAYESKKWAFATDYARLKILYEYGGIYLDTDIEIFKRFDDLLELPYVFTFAHTDYIFGGLFMCEPHNPFIAKLIEWYETNDFDVTKCSTKSISSIFSIVSKKYFKLNLISHNEEFINDDKIINVFPTILFLPHNINEENIAYTKHYFLNSWK